MDTKRLQKKIFIVGYSGSGTRILAEAMRRAGLNIGKDLNEPLDYMPILTPMMEHLRDGKRLDKTKFMKLIKGEAIKHPQLLFLADKLKKWYDCYIILIKRDKDTMIRNDFPTHKTYRNLVYFDGYDELIELEQKSIVYDKMHEKEKYCDYVVKFEDIVETPENVNILLEELGLKRINTSYIYKP